ncbi:MAG: adenosine kinase [Micavibrio aeruginosavorus]|uniref:Adenosine kinase n=1 Tax=Micavibrio aeruginosavorus TaxID=349221 RepID=A0A7T5R474_9BACT|nr:MAG: adenosine kinase [Micavibrio aeruginosavorus]
MKDPKIDLLAIGNAIVDVLAQADEAFIAHQHKVSGMIKGGMTLIDEARAVELYAQMPSGIESSGGSAGNTIAGFASFGGKGAYIGKVAQDQLGEVFRHDLKAQGVLFNTQPLAIGAPTARCLILVTPDGQRTMNTYLGAAVELSPIDIDEDIVSSSKITYLEGYLFDPPQAKEAFRVASELAHKAGRKVALSLSDPFCVNRHREDFQAFVENHVDILFANEQEAMALYQTDTFEQTLEGLKGVCEVVVITRGPQGSVVMAGERIVEITAEPVSKVVDTTGAGDQYAAGFLFGYTRGYSLDVCGRLASMAAAEVIAHMGPRPNMKYADFLKKAA